MSVYSDLGLPTVINASGRMTKLGVSCINEEVKNALSQAAQSYVVIDDLLVAAGKQIAQYINCEDVCVCASASSAIALSVASLICKDNLQKVHHFQESVKTCSKREVILLKGHNVNFGAPIDSMIEIGGGKVVEVAYANESSIEDITNAINENTLAIFYVKSHHCVQKNMVTAESVIKVANQYQIPCIVDAAAEEDLSIYHDLGADFVCYSGAKAISGPTSGFAVCKSIEYANNMRLQYKGIGRVMKIGKENCMGLVKAVEIYQKNNGYVPIVTYQDLVEFNNKANEIKGITASIIQDEAGREIYRCKLSINEKIYGFNAKMLVNILENHNPKIYTRDYQANIGSIAIDPRPLNSKEELDLILEVLEKIRKKDGNGN